MFRLLTTNDAARWRFPVRPSGLGAAAGHPLRRASSTGGPTPVSSAFLAAGPPAPPTRPRGVSRRSLKP